jgi:hypothetical protein
MKAILALARTFVLASTAGAGKLSPVLEMDTYADVGRADEALWARTPYG